VRVRVREKYRRTNEKGREIECREGERKNQRKGETEVKIDMRA
jgi:hypothetical protein